MHRQAARHRATDIVMVTEDLAEADQPVAEEDRHGGAEIGDVADAAAGIVGVVPEEDVARLDVVAEILEYRLDDRRVGAAGELPALGVEQRHAIVVLVADHRRAGGALHRRLDLEFGGADRAVDDFELDRPEPGLVRRLVQHHARSPVFSTMRLP